MPFDYIHDFLFYIDKRLKLFRNLMTYLVYFSHNEKYNAGNYLKKLYLKITANNNRHQKTIPIHFCRFGNYIAFIPQNEISSNMYTFFLVNKSI